ncbi:MAG: DUF2334 domain-containing protein [Bacilli bacterium]|jgi:predicted deacetylase
MKICYIRFDDICPTMDWKQFERAKELMDKYKLKPLIGVIPDNEDDDQKINNPKDDFWKFLKQLEDFGWTIALHGYKHVYDQKKAKTIMCGYKHSEFAGNSFDNQNNKILQGKRILQENNIFTNVFFAPAHSYDKTTLRALKENGFVYNCDGGSPFPYRQQGIICIPCKNGGVPRKVKNGINSIVCHPSEWRKPEKEAEYFKLEAFCEKYHNRIVPFKDILNVKPRLFVIQKILEKLHLLFGSAKNKVSQILRR